MGYSEPLPKRVLFFCTQSLACVLESVALLQRGVIAKTATLI